VESKSALGGVRIDRVADREYWRVGRAGSRGTGSLNKLRNSNIPGRTLEKRRKAS